MSKTYRVIIQPEAQAGMESAFQWVSERSSEAALRWLNGIMDAIRTLETFPTRCSLAPENGNFQEEIRYLLYGKRGGVYRILFTIQRDSVHILYIRHSAQAWMKADNVLNLPDENGID